MIGVGDWKATDLIIYNVEKVLQSGRISYGPFSRQFEESVATLHLNDFGVLANSGTSALLVALEAMKEAHGWAIWNEVLVPASTFVATFNVVRQAGLTPILVDVDPDHYLLDTDIATAKVNERTVAVIPVHLFGQPADVRALAWANKLKILEDSCECFGLNSIATGDITCFSFYISHILSTGVGGMAVTDNSEYATLMRSLVNHGRDNIYITLDDNIDRLSEVIGKRFSFPREGHSFRVTELESAIGLAQLGELSGWLLARRNNALRLKGMLIDLKVDKYIQLPGERENGQHSWMMFPMVCRSSSEKKHLCNFLEQRGIETRDALPLVTQPVYKIEKPEVYYPNAYRLATCGFYVGCHPMLDAKQIAQIASVIKEWCDASYV